VTPLRLLSLTERAARVQTETRSGLNLLRLGLGSLAMVRVQLGRGVELFLYPGLGFPWPGGPAPPRRHRRLRRRTLVPASPQPVSVALKTMVVVSSVMSLDIAAPERIGGSCEFTRAHGAREATITNFVTGFLMVPNNPWQYVRPVSEHSMVKGTVL